MARCRKRDARQRVPGTACGGLSLDLRRQRRSLAEPRQRGCGSPKARQRVPPADRGLRRPRGRRRPARRLSGGGRAHGADSERRTPRVAPTRDLPQRRRSPLCGEDLTALTARTQLGRLAPAPAATQKAVSRRPNLSPATADHFVPLPSRAASGRDRRRSVGVAPRPASRPPGGGIRPRQRWLAA